MSRARAGFDARLRGVALLLVAIGAIAAACTPTIKVEAPDKPIVINLNVKIEQEVRIKIERELEQEFESNPDLFQ